MLGMIYIYSDILFIKRCPIAFKVMGESLIEIIVILYLNEKHSCVYQPNQHIYSA